MWKLWSRALHAPSPLVELAQQRWTAKQVRDLQTRFFFGKPTEDSENERFNHLEREGFCCNPKAPENYCRFAEDLNPWLPQAKQGLCVKLMNARRHFLQRCQRRCEGIVPGFG